MGSCVVSLGSTAGRTDFEHSRASGIVAAEPTPTALAEMNHQEKLRRALKDQNDTGLFIPRQVSKRLTPLFARLGLSANHATAIWGLLSLANTVVVYLAIAGHYLLIPLVFAVFFVVQVMDCVDGEIARYTGTANPIGGKLLDGAWHQATHFALLVAYVAGVWYWRDSPWILPIGMALISGEAMYTYIYERRLTAIRVFAKSTEYINPTGADDMYRWDEPWQLFSRRKKLKALRGIIWYKSIYFMIAISYISVDALLAGLVLLAAYKHYSWIKMLVRTVNRPPQPADV